MGYWHQRQPPHKIAFDGQDKDERALDELGVSNFVAEL